MHLKMSSGKWQPSCLGLSVLKYAMLFITEQCVTRDLSYLAYEKGLLDVSPSHLSGIFKGSELQSELLPTSTIITIEVERILYEITKVKFFTNADSVIVTPIDPNGLPLEDRVSAIRGRELERKRKCRRFYEIFITGCTGSCHFDNFQCSQ